MDSVIECNTSDMVLRLVAQRLGVAIVPDSLPATEVEALGLKRIPLLGGKVRRRVVAITKAGRSASPAFPMVLSLLADFSPPGQEPAGERFEARQRDDDASMPRR